MQHPQKAVFVRPKPFARRRDTLAFASAYTTRAYREVRNARAGRAAAAPLTKELNLAMVRSMKTTPFRAPHRPLGCDDVRFLYRGVEDVRRVGTPLPDGGYADPSFMSFTTDLFTALDFAKSGTVYRLRLTDVRPGTPWLWTRTACDKGDGAGPGPGRHDARHAVRSTLPQEKEVMLPPGALRFKPVKKPRRYTVTDMTTGQVLQKALVDVTFEPDMHATSLWTSPKGHAVPLFTKSQRSPKTTSTDQEGYVPLHALLDDGTRPALVGALNRVAAARRSKRKASVPRRRASLFDPTFQSKRRRTT